MKIAVALEGKSVSEHFGHCEGFGFYEVSKENKIVDSTVIPNPGHQPGFLPEFLKDKGADVIISGGMGGRAKQLFLEKSIEVVVGASGDKDDVVNRYINGQLKSTESVCSKHQHAGDCGNH